MSSSNMAPSLDPLRDLAVTATAVIVSFVRHRSAAARRISGSRASSSDSVTRCSAVEGGALVVGWVLDDPPLHAATPKANSARSARLPTGGAYLPYLKERVAQHAADAGA